jgi:hypothetical protein
VAFPNAGGFATYNKPQLDSYLSALAQQWNGTMNQLNGIRLFLSAHPDADFTALTGSGPTGYTAGDIAVIKSGFLTDAGAMYDIYTGAATLGVARDFRAFIKQLTLLTN